MAISFDTLNPDATIFQELKKNPSWWVRFKNNPSLYIEIRKDNQVNVYFEGGSVARIHYCSKHKKLQVLLIINTLTVLLLQRVMHILNAATLLISR